MCQRLHYVLPPRETLQLHDTLLLSLLTGQSMPEETPEHILLIVDNVLLCVEPLAHLLPSDSENLTKAESRRCLWLEHLHESNVCTGLDDSGDTGSAEDFGKHCLDLVDVTIVVVVVSEVVKLCIKGDFRHDIRRQELDLSGQVHGLALTLFGLRLNCIATANEPAEVQNAVI